MKRFSVIFFVFLISFSLIRFGVSQEVDKAALEKAAQDKEAQMKQMQNTPQAQPPAPYAAPPAQSGQNLKDAAVSGGAGSQYIPCPVTQIEARITNGVPSDWWETPQVGRFQYAQVNNIGGAATLQCFYWAYDRAIPIMKRAPLGTTCTPQGAGFQCR